ncbi:MAG: molybdopterin molybdenumtransferase MoeA [Gammaproteobacteria bacterium]|nr:MAG: molybdopterin molybdenumtransferase MoeA [Gammaproteobacteria bacterium]
MNNSGCDCCSDKSEKLLPLADALEKITSSLTATQATEVTPLRQSLGRILADNIHSPIDIPPHRNSAMDGYALCSGEITEHNQKLQLIGTSWAGKPWQGKAKPGQCIRIFTGAVVPACFDTVVMQEKVEREGETISFPFPTLADKNIRLPGEDIRKDEQLLEIGRQLTPADLGTIASMGISEVRIKQKLRVAFFSTGDELRSIGELLNEGDIYDSNRYSLYGMLKRLNIELLDMGVIPDERRAVEAAFLAAAKNADAIITSGGVSVGEADFVTETLEKLGQVNLWKIAMKPGKPLAYGTIQETAFFGLPGNPVSAMVTFYQVVRPALLKMMGAGDKKTLRLKLPCNQTIKRAPGRIEFQRGVLKQSDDGELCVTPLTGQGSHILSSMSKADCFIIIPAECAEIAAGEVVVVEPFDSII